ncbi:hypothetical protein CHL78_006810 [Romboutsia weinsteinii]|uniref:Polymer-forming cytoskeletal protein n=1 Tax=Romboutsia weinsteinii TaxID=2020949 RepID=A0A371J5Q4_9FIRM|nr:polymer-forming cytoskeletal protein [Romboutsia weinsteinii]RDY28008.1 hypothetical protein CHL78_006810 [Romboutsia weinsteinii]
MKKTVFTILTLIMFISFSINIFADEESSASNLFLFENHIDTQKDISGDIYAAGETVVINSKTGGDVIACGSDIKVLSEEVTGNTRAAGESITIDVLNTKNITVAGRKINISSKSSSNAIYAACEDIVFKGETNDIYISAKNIIIDGIVKGNVKVNCENLTITDNAKLSGKIEVKSPNEPIVGGTITLNDIDYSKTNTSSEYNINHMYNAYNIISSLVTAMIFGLIIFIIFRSFFYEREKLLPNTIGKNILIGLCMLIFVPAICIVLLISIIGIPFGIILTILYCIMIYLCPVISGIFLGRFVLGTKNEYLQVLIGIVIIKVLLWIPFVSIIVWFACVSITFGTVTLKVASSISRKF